MIYTDGSGYEGAIGAAAVLYHNSNKRGELRYRLGYDTQHTVFEGELTAVLLGPQLARNFAERRSKITINIDNQAAILTMKNPRPQAAQYLVQAIKRDMATLKKEEAAKATCTNRPEMTIELSWVAGHSGSIGNEEADKQAKLPAEHGSSAIHTLPPLLRNPLPTSISATKQIIDKLTMEAAKSWWKKSKRYKRTNDIDPSLPFMKYTKATEGLNRRQTSLLTQLCIGHIPLNKHLHRIKRHDNPNWPHCPGTPEDINHYLFRCNKYATHRHKLVTNIKRKAFSTPHLLTDPVIIRHTLNFVNATWRSTHIHGDISADLKDDNDRS